MTILLSDPRVSAVPVIGCGEPLVELDDSFGPAHAAVRASLAQRLRLARDLLPGGVGLRVVEGHRSLADQQAILARYAAQLSLLHPRATDAELTRLTSRFVAPVEVAPHVAGAAVDLTLTSAADGRDLDLGTPIDATPEESGGACFLDSPRVVGSARANRDVLARALSGAGLVNYPTEWWHWSYGDRYWAVCTGAPAALYAAVDARLVTA